VFDYRVQLSGTTPLLRQYFPKGTELAGFSEQHLDAVAAELNDRPRKRLEFQTPIEVIGNVLLQ
jgi:IS30 family transposase